MEPYAGGAGLALILLLDGIAEKIHINDADPAIANFWRAVVAQNSQLVEMIAREPVTIEAWHHWRAVMLGEILATPLERGFATLFMNRTNRSGILKGGVIGGKAQSGSYRVDARFLRDQLCERVSRIGQVSKSILVYEEDARSLLVRCHQVLPRKSLIYLDPPYFVKGAGLYRNFYSRSDHERIARLLAGARFRRPWVVSYDNVPEIRQIYSFASSFGYELNYTAQRRYSGDEIMFFSDRLNTEVVADSLRKAA